MKIIVRPALDPLKEIDLTRKLVAAIAEELSSSCGGSDHLNWLEAERHLRRIVGQARRQARKVAAVVAAPSEPVVAACPGCPRRGTGLRTPGLVSRGAAVRAAAPSFA